MAASLATLDELQATGGIEKMRTLGEMLRDGMLAQARSHGIEVTWSGPPALPYMSFKADKEKYSRNKLFCGEAAKHGVYLHPRHNWFLSAAHTEADIKRTLEVTDDAFDAVKKQFGE
jgi:glutamate-1-semialdehyde 2,1-aminomutase